MRYIQQKKNALHDLSEILMSMAENKGNVERKSVGSVQCAEKLDCWTIYGNVLY